jgi:hypothetical protein
MSTCSRLPVLKNAVQCTINHHQLLNTRSHNSASAQNAQCSAHETIIICCPAGKPAISDAEFETLRDELLWNGSKVAVLGTDELKFLEATQVSGKGGYFTLLILLISRHSLARITSAEPLVCTFGWG